MKRNIRTKPVSKGELTSYARYTQKIFQVIVTITEKSWHYEPGDNVINYVIATNKIRARQLFENERVGSEYPSYDIKSIVEIKSSGFLFTTIYSPSLFEPAYQLGKNKKKKS